MEKETCRRTIFHEVLSSDMPPVEKRCDRIMQEDIVLIAVGTETTAWALSAITYYVLADPEINGKLKAELMEIKSKRKGAPSLNQLEQLPYLSAVISEGLGLSFGVTAHLQRVSPDHDLIYGDWIIPAGISMKHLSEDFPLTFLDTIQYVIPPPAP
ncbi:MAG: hypothetical protein CL912_21505 [Deltaproteobacteria bacterium]|nr:hypothetical protein [Deltaproteobacteria bacterium]